MVESEAEGMAGGESGIGAGPAGLLLWPGGGAALRAVPGGRLSMVPVRSCRQPILGQAFSSRCGRSVGIVSELRSRGCARAAGVMPRARSACSRASARVILVFGG